MLTILLWSNWGSADFSSKQLSISQGESNPKVCLLSIMIYCLFQGISLKIFSSCEVDSSEKYPGTRNELLSWCSRLLLSLSLSLSAVSLWFLKLDFFLLPFNQFFLSRAVFSFQEKLEQFELNHPRSCIFTVTLLLMEHNRKISSYNFAILLSSHFLSMRVFGYNTCKWLCWRSQIHAQM